MIIYPNRKVVKGLHSANSHINIKRIIVLAVAFMMLITAMLPVSAELLRDVVGGEREDIISDEEALRTEDYRKWAQADPRWGGIRLGSNGRTVAEAGCLVTSVTKLIIQSGYRHQDSFNVADLVNWLNAHGGLSSEGNLYWHKPAEMIEGFEFEGMDWNGGYTYSSALQNRIMDYVRQNKHVVLTVNNYGHYVAVDNAKSLQHNSVFIMDSLNNTAGNADISLASRYSYVNRICVYTGNNGNDSDYIARCSFTMTHLRARVLSSSAYYYTLPCTVNAGEGSEAVGHALQGTVVEVTADIINTLGERWHQILTEDGQHLYIWGPQLEFIEYINDIVIESEDPPQGLLPPGQWYALTENVLSRHLITGVTGSIMNIDGEYVCSGTEHPNVHGGYDISGTAIDAALAFGSLSVGPYCYVLTADCTAESSITGETAHFQRIFTSPFSTGEEPLPVYSVTFLDPVADEIFAIETIAEGFYPVLPAIPEHEGYAFNGWNTKLMRVYEDTVIVVNYVSLEEPEPEPVLPGDADGDGMLTMMDALTVLRYVMNGDEIDMEAADYNGDGSVDLIDALDIMRACMGNA